MTRRKHPPISVHQTLFGQLEINWKKEYKNEFLCPRCEKGKLTQICSCKKILCQLRLGCKSCRQQTDLVCRVPPHISRYRCNIECPNPLCNKKGYNGQKGWIYTHRIKTKSVECKCYFCGIIFKSNSTNLNSWTGSLINQPRQPFNFNEDIWNLQHFYNNPHYDSLVLSKIYPSWFRLEVKRYLYELLKSQQFSSDKSVRDIKGVLQQFGQVCESEEIQNFSQITRTEILIFLEMCQTNSSQTVNNKIYYLKNFLEWLGVETISLIYSRDLVKINSSDTNWLDEVTRQSIKQHLDKIPSPIAHHYLIQLYLAARSRDICQLAFNCLEEENGQWYVKFFQQKNQRWHRILTNREIRQVIEKQQQWIRQTFGQEYEYLFCHFRSIREVSYPNFCNIKPLPHPPAVGAFQNPMVRIIRMLIEKENILDANGNKPHFTGKITRHSRLQEVRTKYGMEAAQLYADHKSSRTTFQHYAPPTREQIAEVDLPFQELLMNPDNKFLPWQSLPERNLLKKSGGTRQKLGDK